MEGSQDSFAEVRRVERVILTEERALDGWSVCEVGKVIVIFRAS